MSDEIENKINKDQEQADINKSLPIDYEAILLELKQPKAVIDKLINVYLKSTAKRIEDIKVAFESKNYQILEDQTHAVKGSSLIYKALKLGNIAKIIELSCKEGDFDKVDKNVPLLLEEFDNIKKYIELK